MYNDCDDVEYDEQDEFLYDVDDNCLLTHRWPSCQHSLSVWNYEPLL
jgi:hypothetical protein